MKEIKFLYTDPFCKAFKKLCKKYPSLEQDFLVFCKLLQFDPTGKRMQTVQINNLGDDVYIPIFKVRKFVLRCMKKSQSGIRIVYAYDPEHHIFEFVEFIEIYHKNTQENHDVELIKKLYLGVMDLPSGKAEEGL